MAISNITVDPVTTRPAEVKESVAPEKSTQAKTILVALSALLAIAMFCAYIFAVPWVISLSFLAMALTPFFPVEKLNESHNCRIL